MVPIGPTKNLGPIGSAVLTFIGYKQTDRQTDREAKFIYRLERNLLQSLELSLSPTF